MTHSGIKHRRLPAWVVVAVGAYFAYFLALYTVYGVTLLTGR